MRTITILMVIGLINIPTDLSAQQLPVADAMNISQEDDDLTSPAEMRFRPKKRPQSNKMENRTADRQRNFDPQKLFDRLDSNDDELITAAELPMRIRKRFGQFDSDNNRTITRDEFVVGIKNRRNDATDGKKKRMQPRKANQNANKTDNQNTPSVDSLFLRFDKNSDNIISREEAPNRIKDGFSRLDKNGDDGLDTRELISLVERIKAKGGKSKGRYDTQPEKTKGQMPKRPPKTG